MFPLHCLTITIFFFLEGRESKLLPFLIFSSVFVSILSLSSSSSMFLVSLPLNTIPLLPPLRSRWFCRAGERPVRRLCLCLYPVRLERESIQPEEACREGPILAHILRERERFLQPGSGVLEKALYSPAPCLIQTQALPSEGSYHTSRH